MHCQYPRILCIASTLVFSALPVPSYFIHIRLLRFLHSFVAFLVSSFIILRRLASSEKWKHCTAVIMGRCHLKCDGTHAETRFRLSAKRMSPFKSAGGRQFSRLLADELCESAVVMLDIPCTKVVWRVLATHSIRQFPLHFPSLMSPCAITFQLESTALSVLCMA